ncbi:hypothetical protein AX14_013694 [Amanita brunnescens Koide BX004]|nr:hypothetical protein AX14_013694 [Amanita brunnescens Koide BX004]
MSSSEVVQKPPQDIVAIFHASFHPTRGNIVDWSLRASDELNLDHIEFSALPSGLHLIEQDVVYFTKDEQHGVCVFRRRRTTEEGHRGFRLTSLGILLAKSRRPRPWRHVVALKELADTIYARVDPSSNSLELLDEDWEPARLFFEQRKVQRADLGGAGDWNGWSHDLDELKTDPPSPSLTMHLSHLLRILGPSSMTLYKHVIGRRRILIFTLPPVEPACILCHVAADMCFENQVEQSTPQVSLPDNPKRLKSKSKEGISVLGMVTLSDLDRLITEGQTGRGWIACTTDALFLEKPAYYDLLIDLTTSTPNKATRPTFYTAKSVTSSGSPSAGPAHRLSTIRFAWSDVKLWNELTRILGLDVDGTAHHQCCGPPPSPDGRTTKFLSTWPDAWRVYEDVCIICAGLWLGSWRGNSKMSYSTENGPENWGAVRLDGDDDLTLSGSYVRNRGMGIEGGPIIGSSGTLSSRATKRASAMSWSSSKNGTYGRPRDASSTAIDSESTGLANDFVELRDRQDKQLLTTLALLQTFHAHTTFHLSVLESILPENWGAGSVLYLAPKDILAFELGPLSGNDARYLEWLTYEYADGTQLIVKRGWRDLLNIMFGYS